MTMISCPQCGHTNRPGARFCGSCGGALAATVHITQPTGLLSASAIIGGRYRVTGKLGQGGMAAVYQAEDTRLRGKICAIKEMSDALLADPAERQLAISNFQREAQFLANLSHPNLPRVTDSLVETNKYYLVMDFVSGNTLENLLAQRGHPFSEAEVRGWLYQLCNVLSYLHNHNPPIIFRDLKPDNIMLDQRGQVKLIDFGIARHFDPHKAKDTTALGTLGFAAPEQYGKSQSDARSDLYALGATIHRLLTGHDPSTTPFKIPPVRTLNPQVSQTLSDVIDRCLQLDPKQRWQQIADLQGALGTPPANTGGVPSLAGTQTPTLRVQASRRPTTRLIQATAQLTTQQLALGLGALLLVIVAGILLLAPWVRTNLPLVWNALPVFLLAGPTAYAAIRRTGYALIVHTAVTLVAWLTLWARFGDGPADYTPFLFGIILSGLVIEAGLAYYQRTQQRGNPDAWQREISWYVGATVIAMFVFYLCWRHSVLISQPLLWVGAALIGALGWFLGDLLKEWLQLRSKSGMAP